MKPKQMRMHQLIYIVFIITMIIIGRSETIKLNNNAVAIEASDYIEIIDYYEEYDEYLEEYSNYFNLDPIKVISLAHKLTNDFQDEYEMSIGNTKYTFENKEQGSLAFVYNIYKGKIKVDMSEFKIKRKMKTVKYNEKNKIVMDNGDTFSEFLGHISDLLNMDKSLVLAISNHETGNQKSYLATNKNNFGGLRGSNGWLSFETPEAGIICYIMNIQRIITKNNIKDINKLSGIYVNGNINKPSSTWVNAVNSFYNKINNNSEKYFKTI